MGRYLISGAAILVCSMQGPLAFACGVCIEDRVAAVYDHEVVTNAIARRHDVVFFDIEGLTNAGNVSRDAVAAMVGAVRGVDKGSVRVSMESASLSFSFDPRRQPLAAVQQAIAKNLAVKQLRLNPLKIMEGGAQWKTPGLRARGHMLLRLAVLQPSAVSAPLNSFLAAGAPLWN